MDDKIIEKDYIIKNLKLRLFITKIKGIMVFLLLLAEIGILIVFLIKYFYHPSQKYNIQIVEVNINKVITVPYINNLIDKIEKKKKNPSVKGFLFIFNSPGGSPSASDEMMSYIQDLKKKYKVYGYVESVAASGSYYIASSIKPLYTNPNAIIGSIGVIIPHYNLSKLAKKIGVSDDYIAEGEYKKPISLLKPIDAKNKKYLINHLLKPTYQHFLSVVAKNRNLNISQIKRFAEGQVFIGVDKKIQGILVDKVSHFYKIKNNIKNDFHKQYGNKSIGFIKLNGNNNIKSLFTTKSDINLHLDLNKIVRNLQ